MVMRGFLWAHPSRNLRMGWDIFAQMAFTPENFFGEPPNALPQRDIAQPDYKVEISREPSKSPTYNDSLMKPMTIFSLSLFPLQNKLNFATKVCEDTNISKLHGC